MFLWPLLVLAALAAIASSSSHGPLNANKVAVRRTATRPSAAATCSAISPPPSNHFCGARGTLDPPNSLYPFTSKQITSFETCRDFCLHEAIANPFPLGYTTSCQRFTYDTASKLCRLLNNNSTAEYIANRSSTTRFYDKQCFHCDDDCPQSQTMNLVDNGGFELSQKYIGPWFRYQPLDKGVGQIGSPGHNSPRAFLCSADDAICEIFQYRTLCAEDPFYTFKVDLISVPRPGTPARQQAYLTLGAESFRWFGPYAATSGWRTIFATFQYLTPKQPAAFQIGIDANGNDVYVDNVEVLPAPSSFPTTGNSIVQNGGFESGSLPPWTFSNFNTYADRHGHYRVTSPGLTEGNYKFEFYSPILTAAYGVYSTGPNLMQNVTTLPGTRYQVSFDYLERFRTSYPGGYPSLIRSYLVTFGSSSWSTYSQNHIPRNETAHFSMVATTEDAVTLLTLSVEIEGHDDVHLVVYLDNVQIKALA